MNRVKSLSKSGNPKKDQGVSSLPPVNKESSSTASLPASVDVEDVYEQQPEVKLADIGRRTADKDSSYNAADFDRQPSSYSTNYPLNAWEESGVAPGLMDRERVEMKNTFAGSTSQKMYSSSFSQNSVDTEEKVQKVSPPRRKVIREDKSEKLGNWPRKESGNTDMPFSSSKQQNTSNSNINNVASRPYEPEPPNDGNINAILEVC